MRGRCMLRELIGCKVGAARLVTARNHPHRRRSVLEATQMRIGIAVLISLWCGGCAWLEKPAALAPAPQQAAALEKTAPVSPVADAPPARFECSDGTISTSQYGCLVNMARARLPPGQPADRAPSNSTASQPGTDATR